MQDIHSISGAGRFFGGGDRRIRPLNYQNQSLKCPRCDSINTKFCYYNNYNLSQPRHFCKSCRRYWTKGGVLRNVPVGGGCRKTKRSKPEKSSEKKSKSNENSSSESSSLTTTTPARAQAPEDVAPATCLTSKTASFDFPAIFCTNPNFEPISSEIGKFDPTAVNLNRSDVPLFRSNQQQNHEQSWQLQSHVNDEMTVGFVDQTVHIDLPRLNQQQSNNEAGFAPLDWQLSGGGDQNLFEFTTTVDQSYWNQNQWPSSDHDPTLYLP